MSFYYHFGLIQRQYIKSFPENISLMEAERAQGDGATQWKGRLLPWGKAKQKTAWVQRMGPSTSQHRPRLAGGSYSSLGGRSSLLVMWPLIAPLSGWESLFLAFFFFLTFTCFCSSWPFSADPWRFWKFPIHGKLLLLIFQDTNLEKYGGLFSTASGWFLMCLYSHRKGRSLFLILCLAPHHP